MVALGCSSVSNNTISRLRRISTGTICSANRPSATALAATRATLQRNRLEGRIIPSDGLSGLGGTFDWIVSNPPFHRGVGNDLETAQAFFRGAGTFLAEKGKILVVFNRHLPYMGWIKENFDPVDILERNREFCVVMATKPS